MNVSTELDDKITYELEEFVQVFQKVLATLYGFMSLSLVFHVYVIGSLVQFFLKKIAVRHFVYVLTLTIVDAVVLSHLPFLVVEIATSRWIFGYVLCKFFWIAESVNKLMSTFVLTILSYDRFVSICRTDSPPVSNTGCQKLKPTLGVTALCVVASFGLMMPIYINAVVANVGTVENPVLKCVLDWDEDVEQKVTYVLFITGYCIPMMTMIYFYSRIVFQLRYRARLFQSNRVAQRSRAVAQRTLALVVFYFVCWTPFWLMSFFVNGTEPLYRTTVIASYFVHALVYFNSAMNPVLYVLLNTEYRRRNGQPAGFQLGRITSRSLKSCSSV